MQGEEKFSVEKRLLYPSASAKLELKTIGDTVPVDVGAVAMAVGGFDTFWAETVDDGEAVFDTCDEEVVLDTPVMELRSIVIAVVKSDCGLDD